MTEATVWDVNNEIKKIDYLCELGKSLIAPNGISCPSAKLTITSKDLDEMVLRLYDLKQMYVNSKVQLPIVCRSAR